MKALLLVGLLVAACATPTVTVKPEATPTFDLAAVRANFIDQCRDPIDATSCQQVNAAGMTADGEILNVPTSLSPSAHDRGVALCEEFASAHFDGLGHDLGYKVIGILDSNGGHLAACSV